MLVAKGSPRYRESIESWRKEHDEGVLGPEGAFTVICLWFPKEGTSRIGSDKSYDLRAEDPNVPEYIGDLKVSANRVELTLADRVQATLDKHVVGTVTITGDESKELVVGRVKLRFRWRNGAPRVSVVDPDSPLRAKASHLHWFPPDEKYRVTANWIPYPQPKPMHVADSDGGSRDWECPGHAAFEIAGQRLTLEPFITPGDNSLFFAFRDTTAGHETYGAGRFFEAEMPKGGKVILDFNKAYNPLCAYNHFFFCPVPPKQNRLFVAIPAGEKMYEGTPVT
jgi:hypothetical protein